MRVAKRVQELPPYLFAELERKNEERRAAGIDVIALGIGDPDLPTPPHIVAEALRRGGARPGTHQLPVVPRGRSFREAVADFYEDALRRRRSTRRRRSSPLHRLEGGHRPLPRSRSSTPATSCSCPTPATRSTRRARASRAASRTDCRCRRRTASCPTSTRSRRTSPAARTILWINYPNNPTGALAELGFFEQAGRVRAEARHRSSPRPRLQRDLLRRLRRRRASCRRRARARSASSSTRCRRPTT